MKSINNPIWLILLNTVPSIILMILGYNIWSVVKSQLQVDETDAWALYASVLGLMTFSVGAYSCVLMYRKRLVSTVFTALILIGYLTLFCIYGIDDISLVPWSIPRWMVPEDLNMYIGSFLMPTLIYSLVHLVVWAVKLSRESRPFFSLLYALAIPLSIYLFSQVIVPIWNPFGHNFPEHVFVIFGVILSVAFLFFFLSWIYRVALKRNAFKTESWIYRVLLSVVLPFLGLMVNNGAIDIFASASGSGVFGDFHSLWFYGLTFLNAIFFLLPDREGTRYNLFRFFGRSVTYMFILYFVLVFLPYVPFSLPGVFVFGLGFLLLSPLFLIVIQSKDLFDDWQFLSNYFTKWALSIVLIIGLASIPAVITTSYFQDRSTITDALDKVYDASFDEKININIDKLSTVIKNIKENKKGRPDFMGSNHLPFLTSYYNNIVLDNLTLSRNKIRKLEAVFLDKPFNRNPQVLGKSSRGIEIKSLDQSSEYDEASKSWNSWVNFEIENTTNVGFKEYVTKIELPEGVWISDYYLYVGDRKESGILTDKKSANWIYNQIRNQNKDPGLLSYDKGNSVSFKVFPFAPKEVRRTGIQFSSKDPFELDIDGQTLQLGNKTPQKSEVQVGNVVYLSGVEKNELSTVERKPYFHFIVDASLSKKNSIQNDIERYSELMGVYPDLSTNAQISFVNSNIRTHEFDGNKDVSHLEIDYEGGFYLDRAIKSILTNAYKNPSINYPVIVLDAEDFGNAIFENDYSDLSFAVPELENLYLIGNQDTINCHSLYDISNAQLDFVPFDRKVKTRVWPSLDNPEVYLKDNQMSSVFIIKNEATTKPSTPWENGLSMHGQWMMMHLYPEIGKSLWYTIIQNSFRARIMTPLTSFIVVENEAQKEVLLRKQKEVLSGDKNMDLSGDPQQMSEPGLWVLLLIFLFLWLKHKKKQRVQPFN